MRYLPHTDEEIAAMLSVVGAGSLDDLFSAVPQSCRRTRDMDLPEPLSEWDLNRLMAGLSNSVAASREYRIYAGAGSDSLLADTFLISFFTDFLDSVLDLADLVSLVMSCDLFRFFDTGATITLDFSTHSIYTIGALSLTLFPNRTIRV